jgi:DNA-directed RNA polymerase subunit M/transcription elongation factor TFIIS
MLEFCNKCGSILRPSKDNKTKVLICSLCNNVVEISDEIEKSYIFHEEINHQEEI